MIPAPWVRRPQMVRERSARVLGSGVPGTRSVGGRPPCDHRIDAQAELPTSVIAVSRACARAGGHTSRSGSQGLARSPNPTPTRICCWTSCTPTARVRSCGRRWWPTPSTELVNPSGAAAGRAGPRWSLNASVRNDPFASWTGGCRDQVEVGFVVQPGDIKLLGGRGDQQRGDLAASLAARCASRRRIRSAPCAGVPWCPPGRSVPRWDVARRSASPGRGAQLSSLTSCLGRCPVVFL